MNGRQDGWQRGGRPEIDAPATTERHASGTFDAVWRYAGGKLGVKPGWVRINFNYFISDTVADYLIEAVDLVARHGHRLLTDYRFDPRTGLWRHHRGPGQTLTLADLSHVFDSFGSWIRCGEWTLKAPDLVAAPA